MDLRKQKCVLDVKLESMITFANTRTSQSLIQLMTKIERVKNGLI